MGPAPAEGRWEAATPVLPHGPAPLPPLPAGPTHPPWPQAGLCSTTGRARAPRHSPAAPARGRRHRSPPVPTAAQAPRRDGGQMAKRPSLSLSAASAQSFRREKRVPASAGGPRAAPRGGAGQPHGVCPRAAEGSGARTGKVAPRARTSRSALPFAGVPRAALSPPRGAERQRRPRAPRPARAEAVTG